MDEQTTTVMLIEDDIKEVQHIRQFLAESKTTRFVVHFESRLDKGLERLAAGGVDVLLLDLDLPDSQGIDTFRRVFEQAPELPVVVLTGRDDDAVVKLALQEGAHDYLVKDQIDSALLTRSLRYAIERQGLQEALGSLVHDPLTCLYNRRIFLTLGEQHLKVARRTKQSASLMFVDIDDLKKLNQLHTHREGNRALVKTATLLLQTFRSSDILARVGGDEFAVLMLDTTAGCDEMLRMRWQMHLQQHNSLPDRRYRLSVSAGIARFDPAHPCSISELLARAMTALAEQKKIRQQSGKTGAPQNAEAGRQGTKDTIKIRRSQK